MINKNDKVYSLSSNLTFFILQEQINSRSNPMINFASLFNQFKSSSNNAINDILEQDGASLSRLLDEESFINQFKSGNTKVIDFMKYQKTKELIDFITKVGPEQDKKRSFKFPLAAADILSSDSSALISFFFPEGDLFEEIKTMQDQQIEVQVDVEDVQTPAQSQKNQGEPQKQEKQKTIIKDSLETSEQESKQKQPITTQQNAPDQQKVQNIQPQTITQPQTSSQQLKPKVNQKAKIKVKKIEQVQKIQKLKVEPLIGYLFEYFNRDVNYILTGYVCKALTALFSKKGNEMLEFLFRDNKIEKMITHIQSRSVGEFLTKVMTFQSNILAKERASFFKKLLQQLAQNNTVEVLSNFSAFISETIEKAATNAKSASPVSEFTNIFFTPQIVTLVIQNVMSDFENVSVYNAPILLTYLTNVPFTLPQDQNIVNQFKGLLKLFVHKSLEKINVNNNLRPKLGYGRVKIIQILTYILKQNLLGSRQIFGTQQRPFQILFNLCKNYELNNVLHNEVVKIVSIALSDEGISSSLLKNDVLTNFLLTQAQQDVEIRNGTGSQKFRKGFIGHIVQMSRLIQEYSSKGNSTAYKIQERDQFAQVLNILVERQVHQSSKSLAGFSFKRQIKQEIMFQKQDIITHYMDFLIHSPKPVFQSEPQHINIEHPDFLEEMQRQIEENLSIDENGDENGKSPVQIEISTSSSQHQIRVQVQFFKGHLDYDVDILMSDL